jgi:hypothetical protein
MPLRPCRDCGQPISDEAVMCPNCGAGAPGRQKRSGCGYALFSILFFLFTAALTKALTGH